MLLQKATKSIPLRWILLVIEVLQLLMELQSLDIIDKYPLKKFLRQFNYSIKKYI